MTREEFRRLTSQGPVILDGATGSNLMKAGMPRGVCTEQWCLDHPEAILDLQRRYVEAGSQIIYAPTFTGSAPYLAQHGLEDQMEEINGRLVELSRRAADGRAYVAGDMTTVGTADITYEELLPIYLRQAKALAAAGVDLFVVETMMGLPECLAALEACRMAADLPVLCSFSVMSDGTLYFGGDVFDAAVQLEEFGADAVGINCSTGPDQLVSVVRFLAKKVRIPIIAKPNAGMPVIDDRGNAVYSMDAASFGSAMEVLRHSGASILGGCCGTDSSYIRAIAKR